MAFLGNGVFVPPATYAKCLSKSVARVHARVADQKLRGADEFRNEQEGIQWLRSAACAGDAAAQFELGQCHDEGRGVEQDAVAAVRWYESAAQLGNADAVCALGYCYAKGEGVPKDEKAAIRLFMRAAHLQLPVGMFNLAVCYAKGRGLNQPDLARAVELYTKAADQGHLGAAVNLALCLEKGQGAAADPAGAFAIYKRVFEEHGERCPAAQYHLARCLFRGVGTGPDPGRAAEVMGDSVWDLGATPAHEAAASRPETRRGAGGSGGAEVGEEETVPSGATWGSGSERAEVSDEGAPGGILGWGLRPPRLVVRAGGRRAGGWAEPPWAMHETLRVLH